MRILLAALLLLLAVPLTGNAQAGPPATPGEILLGLKKLQNTGAVLYIAAHPDDENTKLLAYLASERRLRTGYLSLTRGDGGQNLIGKEQGEMLGLLRTQELLAARRVDGAEQFFTRANDFGFSKNPEETFSIWNREQVLADVVWTIRKFRPDVIICRFPTTGEGGHGHHTASAILAAEAFDAAPDPKRFPEQLAYVSPWKTRRLFWNTFNFGTTNTTAPDQLKIDVGVYNPLLGKSYGEIAAESRTMHKSQGFGTARTRGESLEYFKQLKGDPAPPATNDSATADLFSGINTTWTRHPELTRFAAQTAALAKAFNPAAPQASVPGLVALAKGLRALKSNDPTVKYWTAQKLKETEALIVGASGLWLEATSTAPSAIPEFPLTITAQVLSRSSDAVRLDKLTFLDTEDTTTALKARTDVLYSFPHTMKVPGTTSVSAPYWLAERHDVGMYLVQDDQKIGLPENPDNPKVRFDLTVNGMPLSVERNIVFKSVDPVKGEVYRPLEILPPVSIELSDKVLVFNREGEKRLPVTIRANRDGVVGTVSLDVPDGWQVGTFERDIRLAKKGDGTTIVVPVKGSAVSRSGRLGVKVKVEGATYSKSIRRLEYDHVPYQFMQSDADVALVNVDLKKRGTAIGYIPGAGDDVPAALAQVGYTVTMLTNDMLGSADLSKYDAIVTGVRAFNVNEQLPRYHDRLMEYVRNGGNFIVQYNTNTRLGPMTAQPGPWPYTTTGIRVTDERAAVTFTNPSHPVLNTPNKITPADFEGWIQERGIYFAADSANRYETVLAMNDKGEQPQTGSLIIGKYGRGNFVYTGLVFFRQLPAGNPGAYRLFVNLLSLPPNEDKK